jgi:hypothetical protein
LISAGRVRIDPRIAVPCLLTLIACTVAWGGLLSHAYPGDTLTYERYGRYLVEQHHMPYRWYFVEYPPGAIPVFALPALLWSAHYVLVFKLLMALCAIGFTACAAWTLRRLGLGAVRLVPVVLAPVTMGPYFLNRYDPVPALIVSLAIVTMLLSHDRATGALIGAGTAVKLYAIVLVPVLAMRVRSLRKATIAFAIGVGVFVLPFAVTGAHGMYYTAKVQLRRHLQIESLGSSILLVGSKLGIHHVQWIAGQPGSIDLGGTLPDVVATFSAVFSIVLVLLVALAFRRGEQTDRRLVTACAAAVTAYTVFGKVLSPQYLTWLVPLIPLAAGRRGLYAAGCLLAALPLTTPIDLLDRFGLRHQTWIVWLLLIRNVLLVAAFCLLYLELRAGRSGSPQPVRRPLQRVREDQV